jgi:micrococcal nuclease
VDEELHNPRDVFPRARQDGSAQDAEHTFEPIQNPDDLLGEAVQRLNERQREWLVSRAAEEALRLGVKQAEDAVDQVMERSAVSAAAEAARRLHGNSADYEVRTEHRSQHGSVYFTVRSAPPPLIARPSPRISPLARWIPAAAIAVAVSAILMVVVVHSLGGWGGSGASPTGVSSSSAHGHQVSATRFVDGDTLAVSGIEGGAIEEKVRLLAIDTPERGQRWYTEAGIALRDIVGNRPIHLEYESPGKLQRDKYGRVLAYLIVDGQNVNVEMVRRGWSAYVTKYGGDRYSKVFAAAEDEARVAYRGIWSAR